MNFSTSSKWILAVCLVAAASTTEAFVGPHDSTSRSTTSMAATSEESSRRQFLVAGLFGAASTLATVAAPQPAEATYSAYAAREKDWEERLENGQVQIKSSRDLRRQLAEIVPQNSEGSKIFCPNGPSAAVSPLMENKCGDRAAIPSVYGRTEDSMGNSIPGFKGGFYSANGGEKGSLSANPMVGGFPKY